MFQSYCINNTLTSCDEKYSSKKVNILYIIYNI